MTVRLHLKKTLSSRGRKKEWCIPRCFPETPLYSEPLPAEAGSAALDSAAARMLVDPKYSRWPEV